MYNAERLNGLLGRHWRRFARQDYFDKHGVFFCALVSTPLLLDMFVILVRRPCPPAYGLLHVRRQFFSTFLPCNSPKAVRWCKA